MKKRNLKQSRYGHLYKQVQTTWGDCIYCGQHATQVDHVPALDTVESYGERHFIGYRFVTVPCCPECNSALGSKPLATVKLRAAVLLGHYADKYSKLLLNPVWKEELYDLEGRLREYVQTAQDHKLLVERRIEYLERIDERMHLVNQVQPYASGYDDDANHGTRGDRSKGLMHTLNAKREAQVLGYLKELRKRSTPRAKGV